MPSGEGGGEGGGHGRATSATPREGGRDRPAVRGTPSTRPTGRARDRRPGAPPRQRDGLPSPGTGRRAWPSPPAAAGATDGRRRGGRSGRRPSTAPRAHRPPRAARRSRWRRPPPSGPAGTGRRRSAGDGSSCAVSVRSRRGRFLPVPAAGCAGDLGEPTLHRLLLVLVVPVPPHVRRGLGI